MNCIFCKIINGEIPCYKLYEDDLVLCFLDVNPDSNGHCLIIPKEHYLDLDDISDDVLNHIMKVSKKIKKLLEDKLNIQGLTLMQNNGEAQEVKHYHLHLKPYPFEKKENINIEDVYKKITE